VFNAIPAADRFNVNNRAYQFNGFTTYLEELPPQMHKIIFIPWFFIITTLL
jgi:hypothetical protein